MKFFSMQSFSKAWKLISATKFSYDTKHFVVNWLRVMFSSYSSHSYHIYLRHKSPKALKN